MQGSLLVGGPIPVLAARVDLIPLHRQDIHDRNNCGEP